MLCGLVASPNAVQLLASDVGGVPRHQAGNSSTYLGEVTPAAEVIHVWICVAGVVLYFVIPEWSNNMNHHHTVG